MPDGSDDDRSRLLAALGQFADFAVVVSDESNDILWRAPLGEGVGVGSSEGVVHRTHPDDLARMFSLVNQARAHPGEVLKDTVRIQQPDDPTEYIRWEVIARDFTSDSDVGGMLLVGRDLEHMRSVDLDQPGPGFEALAALAPVGIAVLGHRGDVSQLNRHGQELLGVMGPVDLVALLGLDEPTLWSTTDRAELLVEPPNLPGLWLAIRLVPQHTQSGDPSGWIMTLTDVSDLVSAREELIATRDEAIRASRAKSDFLAHMSHELRTPLNSVIGFAKLLSRNGGGRLDADEIAYLDRIDASGQHLLHLIEDLLDLSRIEADRLDVDPAPLNFSDLVDDVVASMEPLAGERDIILRASVPSAVSIVCDPRRLRQILLNLLSNALKFAPAGEVDVTVEVADTGVVRCAVADTGVGIDADQLERIFHPFAQADTGPGRRYDGAGLGLAIVSALCDQLGIDLEVTSEVGEGSTFTLTFPPNEE